MFTLSFTRARAPSKKPRIYECVAHQSGYVLRMHIRLQIISKFFTENHGDANETCSAFPIKVSSRLSAILPPDYFRVQNGPLGVRCNYLSVVARNYHPAFVAIAGHTRR